MCSVEGDGGDASTLIWSADFEPAQEQADGTVDLVCDILQAGVDAVQEQYA